MITYFLALPLTPKDMLRFKRNATLWSLFMNQSQYLDLILYQGIFYLAKHIPDFPLSLEEWDKHVAHVSSMLRHTFKVSSIEALQLLPCTRGWVKESIL